MGDMALEQRSKTGENWKWDVCIDLHMSTPRCVVHKEVTFFINRMSQHISKDRKSGNIWAVASRIFRDGRLISYIQIPVKERK